MRKITTKERQHGMKYCTFCRPAKIDAIYRQAGLGGSHWLACEAHKDRIQKDSDHLTEADYQTWFDR